MCSCQSVMTEGNGCVSETTYHAVSEASRTRRERKLTSLTVPSQELEMNVSLVTGFQETEKVSLLCSWKFMTGNSLTPRSKSFNEPSPQAVISWFSWISDHARSYRASFVSKLIAHKSNRQPHANKGLVVAWRNSMMEGDEGGLGGPYVFSTCTPCAVSPRAKTRPLPTIPKLAEVATAIRES